MRSLSKSLLLCLALALAAGTAAPADRTKNQRDQESEARLRKDVFFLASPLCEGRGPNTDGINRAADYIAREFKKIGLRPGFKGGYFQPFKVAGAKGSLTLVGPGGRKVELKPRLHFNPLGSDQSGEASGEVVFAGYGLSCANPPYDDYEDIDVSGKIVVVIRDTPRASDPRRSREMAAGAALASKLTLAQKKGAAAVLLVNDADTASDGDMPLDYSYTRLMRGPGAGGGKRIPALAVRRSVLEMMLPPDRTLAEIEKQIDRDMRPASMALPGWKARVSVKGGPEVIPLKNVVGVLEGSGPLADETVVVGAHYDHLGYGGPASMAPGKKRAIHYGADDNGSGTTGILELARRFAGIPNRKGRRLVFVAFSGEELGLLGSRYYCNHPAFPLDRTAAMFNLDMIGRLRADEKTGLFRMLTEGHGTAEPFKGLLDAMAKKHHFGLSSKASGFGPSDHASFCGKGVPVLFFWTGVHADYHRPTDTADKINVAGMRQIVDAGEEVVAALATMPRPKFVEVKGAMAGARPSSGPRLGIRPNYSEGGPAGVEVEGVVEGGPAAKGGVKEGDRIVKISGKEVKDLGAYMQAMATQQRGSTIEVVVVRKGKEVKLSLKLE